MAERAPYSIAPTENPAKLAFSAKYNECGIFGALGLSDHGFPEEFAITQTCTAGEGVRAKGGRRTEMRGGNHRARWEEMKGVKGYKVRQEMHE